MCGSLKMRLTDGRVDRERVREGKREKERERERERLQ